jgi:hypothetical protein
MGPCIAANIYILFCNTPTRTLLPFLCWGIRQKPFTLETSDLPNSWINSRLASGWKVLFHKETIMKTPCWISYDSRKFLMLCEDNSRIVFGSQVCCLFQDDWNLAKLRRPGTREVRESGGVSIRESRQAMIFMNKASKVKEEPSQRRHLKSPGSKCELVTGLWMYEISLANHGM